MKYNKAYKFRLLPNKEQEIKFAKTFGCVRFIWNKMLSYTKNYYTECGKTDYITPAKFKKEFPWLTEIDSLALANAQVNLKKAFAAFFSKISNIPRFKGKKDTRQSYTTNNQEASNAIRIEGNFIRLPKLGLVRFEQHRLLKEKEKIKTCTISKSSSNKYYISITVEGIQNVESINISKDKVIGLDFSMSQLYVSNEGEIANYPRYYRLAEKKLQKLYKSLSRKIKGSNNRYKARLKLAKFHEYISNIRNDFLHKLSYKLANMYDAIVVEDLNMQNMSKSLHFGKSVSDNGWGKFINILRYKLIDRGKQLIKIDKWIATSKTCSSCKTIKKELQLSERVYNCESCGYSQNRDINAAINIRTAGMAGLAW